MHMKMHQILPKVTESSTRGTDISCAVVQISSQRAFAQMEGELRDEYKMDRA